MLLWRSSLAHAENGSTLVIADQRGDHGLLAPYTHAVNGFAYVFTSYVFDSLVGQNAQGSAVPALAAAWRLSADHLTWDLDLNRKAFWHDGKPVTTEDVLFTLDYMRRHPYVFATLDTIASAAASGSNSLRIRLGRPDAGFIRNVLMALPILPRHVYADQPSPRQFVSTLAATGSGPYRLTKYDKAQGRYLLERNDNYYQGLPQFARIVIVRMSPEAAIEGIRRGDVDVLTDLPAELVARAKGAKVSMLTATSAHVERLVFNHHGLLANRSARQALACALDRQALVDIAHPGAADVAAIGYFQPGSPWFSSGAAQPYPHDRQRAERLFRSVGWQRSAQGRWEHSGKTITLRLVAEVRFRRMLMVVAEQLETFGIGVDLRILEQASLQQTVSANEFDLLLRSTSTMGDPSALVTRVLGAAWMADRYPDSDGRMRAVIERQASVLGSEERRRLLGRFSEMYADVLPSLMLANPTFSVAHGPRLIPVFIPDGIASGIPVALPKSLLVA
jgi:peptide/nickel transport system substrate-binding protein